MHPNKLFKFESGPNYLPANKIDIHIAVDTSGNSGIKAILIDGEERYFETLFQVSESGAGVVTPTLQAQYTLLPPGEGQGMREVKGETWPTNS